MTIRDSNEKICILKEWTQKKHLQENRNEHRRFCYNMTLVEMSMEDEHESHDDENDPERKKMTCFSLILPQAM
jgi:hypothetical protein